jgi:hypothetical protein
MLHKLNKPVAGLSFFAIFLGVFVFGSLLFSSSQPASAAGTKPDGARVLESVSCKPYKGGQKDACAFGYSTSLGDKARNHLEPTKDYNDDESADASKACQKYKNSGNKKACETGYKDGHYAYYHVSDTNPVTKDGGQESSGNTAGNSGGASTCLGENCTDTAVKGKCDTSHNCDLIGNYLNPAITVLTVSFGIIAVISIIIAGIQYTTSAGDPQKAANAKKRLTNTIIAVVCYFLLYGFLQFIIPGGFLND